MEINADEYFGLPMTAKNILRDLYWNVVFNSIDLILVGTGRERFGKSTLMTHIWLFLDELRKEWGLPPTFDKKKITMLPETYAQTIDDSENKAGDVVMYDEAGTGMYNRESMGKTNVSINKILMTCGYKGLVHLLCLPNFFALDKEVRSRRVAMLFVVSARPTPILFKGRVYQKLNKGFFKMYSAKDVQEIYKDAKTGKVIYPPTRFTNLFFHPLEETQQWFEYEAASKLYKKNYIGGLATELRFHKHKKGFGVEKLETFVADGEL